MTNFQVGEWVRIAGTSNNGRLGRIRHIGRVANDLVWHVVEFRPNVWGQYSTWRDWDEYQAAHLRTAVPTEEETTAWLIEELSQ